jgi:hypothetical protein
MLKLTLAITISILTLGYLLPAGIALGRGHKNAGSIFVLNALTGWTFIGWVAALVWSFTSQK